MKRDNQKGFSLIELIVIFAIMAILMGMLSYSLNLFIGIIASLEFKLSHLREIRHSLQIADNSRNVIDVL